MDLWNVLVPVFSELFKKTMSHTLELPQIIFSKMFLDLSSILLNNLVAPKIEIIDLGGHGHVQKTKSHENEKFLEAPK